MVLITTKDELKGNTVSLEKYKSVYTVVFYRADLATSISKNFTEYKEAMLLYMNYVEGLALGIADGRDGERWMEEK